MSKGLLDKVLPDMVLPSIANPAEIAGATQGAGGRAENGKIAASPKLSEGPENRRFRTGS